MKIHGNGLSITEKLNKFRHETSLLFGKEIIKLFKKIEDRINEKMTPNMIEAFRNSDTWYIVDRFSLLELLTILYWKITGKFNVWNE